MIYLVGIRFNNLRMVSISDRMPLVKDKGTPFLDFLEGKE